MPSILIVDDEPGVRSRLGGVLRDEGYEVDAVDSGEACLERLGRQAYDVVVLDIWLPGMDGLATLARMRERQIEVQVVIISGHGNIEAGGRAHRPPATATRGGEPGAARQGRRAPHHGRRELRDGEAPRAGGDGLAHQRP